MKSVQLLLRNPIIHLMLLLFWFIWFSWAFITEGFSPENGIGYIGLFLKWIVLIGFLALKSRFQGSEIGVQDKMANIGENNV